MAEESLSYGSSVDVGTPRAQVGWIAVLASPSVLIPALAPVVGSISRDAVEFMGLIHAAPVVLAAVILVAFQWLHWIRLRFSTASLLSIYTVCVVPPVVATTLSFSLPLVPQADRVLLSVGRAVPFRHGQDWLVALLWGMSTYAMMLPMLLWLFRLKPIRAAVMAAALLLPFAAAWVVIIERLWWW